MMKMNKAAKWVAIIAVFCVALSGVVTMGAVAASQQQAPTTSTEQPAG